MARRRLREEEIGKAESPLFHSPSSENADPIGTFVLCLLAS
jgi:hypothetical protein